MSEKNALVESMELRARRLYAEAKMLLQEATERLTDEERDRVLRPLEYASDLISMRHTGRPSSALVEVRDMLWHIGDANLELVRLAVGAMCMSESYMELPMAQPLPPPVERSEIGGKGHA